MPILRHQQQSDSSTQIMSMDTVSSTTLNQPTNNGNNGNNEVSTNYKTNGTGLDTAHKPTLRERIYERQLTIILMLSEAIFLILYGCLAQYDLEADVSQDVRSFENNTISKYYPMFQDVNVMIFIGFGFLMTFLRRYSYSAVGFNFLLAAYSIQWSILCRGFLKLMHFESEHEELHERAPYKIYIEITQIINGDFCAGAVLISMGALLGTISAPQYLIMTIIEVVFYAINEYINYDLLKVADIGGSVVIHTFGAYFGLACSRILFTSKQLNHPKEKAGYFDDVFSMLGTIFLWMYWPSFNAALAGSESGQSSHRTVVNTYLSLTASCLASFAVSSLLNHDRRLDMAHIQNATLAGGVAIGASANLLVRPVGALLIGTIAGMISTLGYRYMTPVLRDKFKVHDTCGVNNLHGMPGILGGIISIVMAFGAIGYRYGSALGETYSGIAEYHRSAAQQAAYQLAGLICTLTMAIIGGIFTGLVLRLPCWIKLDHYDFYDDAHFWEIPDEVVTPRPRRHSGRFSGSENFDLQPVNSKVVKIV